MSKIINSIEKLTNLLHLKCASYEQISEAQKELGLQFADEYKEYMFEFGAILADGIELTGIAKTEYRNVVEVTKKSRELNPQVAHDLYVIEDTHIDGVLIWQDETGKIYSSKPNEEVKVIANNLVEYIKSKSNI